MYAAWTFKIPELISLFQVRGKTFSFPRTIVFL
jgi:hypothetical protein